MRASCATWAGHGGAIGAFLVAWEWAAACGALDPAFFARPSGIGAFLWKGFAAGGVLWTDLAYTVAGAVTSFAAGSDSLLAAGVARPLHSDAARRPRAGYRAADSRSGKRYSVTAVVKASSRRRRVSKQYSPDDDDSSSSGR